jgi:hypothetical protein
MHVVEAAIECLDVRLYGERCCGGDVSFGKMGGEERTTWDLVVNGASAVKAPRAYLGG